MREHWAKLPPETQEYVSKREAEATKRISELGTTAKYAEGIRNVVERHRGILNGRNEAEAIDAMLHAATRLSQEPYAAIDWLARSYGVDLRHFAASNPTPDGLAPENAQFAHALAVRDREFSALKQTLDETLNRLRASEQRQADIQNQTLTKLIADFAADKPHWSKLEEEIYAQIRGLQELEPGLSHDRMLQKAYEKATWAHPEVRQAIEAEKAEVARKAKVAEDAKKAEEAKRLAALNVKSRHSATPARSGNWENTLDDIANKIARRG
jgi:hypothetical protein